MIRILKFAKRRWHWMLVIVLLLVGQAYCELTLPQYTSNIVDVGIQYKGIERTIPEIVRPETLQALTALSDEDDRDLIEEAYQLVEKGSDQDLEEIVKDKLQEKNISTITIRAYLKTNCH